MLLTVDDLRDTPELIALAVNLTQNHRNAVVRTLLRAPSPELLTVAALQHRQQLQEALMCISVSPHQPITQPPPPPPPSLIPRPQVLCQNGQIDKLINRALTTRDELIFKVRSCAVPRSRWHFFPPTPLI